jgi:hypothetical protein
MEFRLIYRGPLHAKRSDVAEKHSIRKYIHPQLKELWYQHPLLRDLSANSGQLTRNGQGRRHFIVRRGSQQSPGAKSYVEQLADIHRVGEYRFVPLVEKETGITCSLDILFLRRDNPGGPIKTGGDIDNRLKNLFDGLKKPKNLGEIGESTPGRDEDPFFCLLEDDKLITAVSVTTDRLLLPAENKEMEGHVYIVISAKTGPMDLDLLYAKVHLS